MTPSEFVSGLKSQCRDAAVVDTIETFKSPSGRKPSQSIVEMSNWFNELAEKDRKMVIRAMQEVAGSTLFGVLAVLDGARTIEAQGDKTQFRLIAVKEGKESVISPGPHDLHDM